MGFDGAVVLGWDCKGAMGLGWGLKGVEASGHASCSDCLLLLLVLVQVSHMTIKHHSVFTTWDDHISLTGMSQRQGDYLAEARTELTTC
jgi:hypothetical protein